VAGLAVVGFDVVDFECNHWFFADGAVHFNLQRGHCPLGGILQGGGLGVKKRVDICA
jgi:hypothetical protein